MSHMLDVRWRHRWRDIIPGVGWVNFFRWEPIPYLSEYVCQIWLRSDGRVKKKGGTDRHTDKGTLQLYIVDSTIKIGYAIWYGPKITTTYPGEFLDNSMYRYTSNCNSFVSMLAPSCWNVINGLTKCTGIMYQYLYWRGNEDAHYKW